MNSQYPLCTGVMNDGTVCPKRNSCAHFSEVIHEDDMAFTHAPYSKYKKDCEFYVGIDANALREYIKDILKEDENSK
jgi:hypothetical protein